MSNEVIKKHIQSIVNQIQEQRIQFLRLQFTDLFGKLKTVNVPAARAERILLQGMMFDGSSIDGFVRLEESDMYLKPDLSTFAILPELMELRHEKHQSMEMTPRSARLLCDVYTAEEEPFEGDPRYILKRQIQAAKEMGYHCDIGPEMEFFLFALDEHGLPSLSSYDPGRYFDSTPTDRGELTRHQMVLALDEMGFQVEAAHHECAHAQHEIDFRYTDALSAADQVVTFKDVVKGVAARFGLHSSFMPKPFYGQAGSGMHFNLSMTQAGQNCFNDPKGELGLSPCAHYFIGGLLEHAKALTALTNPTVNSYKRLVPDFEAPCYIAWSAKNRSPLIRIPSGRGNSARVELRSPDSSANPYLAFAAVLAAGLDGIRRELQPPPSVNENIFAMPEAKRRMLGIEALPATIEEALIELEQDPVIMDALHNHCATQFIRAKRLEWKEYNQRISEWEIQNYLNC